MTSLETIGDTRTVYDSVKHLQSIVNSDASRHVVEGGIVFFSALTELTRVPAVKIPTLYDDSIFKLSVSRRVRNSIYNIDTNTQSVDDITSEILSSMDPFIFPETQIKSGFISLYHTASRLIKEVDPFEKRVVICREMGKELELSFKKFYINRGYPTNPEQRSSNNTKYLKAEYDFLTRVAHEIFKKYR